MNSRTLIYLIGAIFIYYQVIAQDIYIAELMVEGNVTLEAETIMSVLNTTTNLEVTVNGIRHTVTLVQSEIIAECIIIGPETTCNCSAGYIWSNEVCYDFNCCSDNSCSANVSFTTPLCISKFPVDINGSVSLNISTWTEAKTAALVTAFKGLNGFEFLNITAQRSGATIVDFQTKVSVKFPTFRLLNIVSKLEKQLTAVLRVDTTGMVTIEAPADQVCYRSSTKLKCIFEEATDAAGWSMSNENSWFQLNAGTAVSLDYTCSTPEYKSCVEVTLNEVTGFWQGKYECGFSKGSVRHTARAPLRVALLPDEIILKISPITLDCSESDKKISGTATILKSKENLQVKWSYRGGIQGTLQPNDKGDYLEYKFDCSIDCGKEKEKQPQYFEVTFSNTKGQKKTARVDIPVIYAGKPACGEETIHGEKWPKTPAGNTAIKRICGEGRVGFKSRTCKGTKWMPVYSNCVSEKIKKLTNEVDYFQQGLGATPEVALNIFEGLRNNSDFDSGSTDAIADINASVNILKVMSTASNKVALGGKVLSPFADAASNMLNTTWKTVNDSILHSMSSAYLESMEDLVENIDMSNGTTNIQTENLNLKYCFGSECNVSLFGVSLSLNQTTGGMKTFAVKNIMDKLGNHISNTNPIGVLISATLEDRSNNSSIIIQLNFPTVEINQTQPLCVFWNTKKKKWSDTGCKVKTKGNNYTICECNHLTSFSVLMAKDPLPNPILECITLVGLIVSISALALFLFIEFLVWSAVVKTNLSHFRHTAMVNIATFLLLGDCCFLASRSPETLKDSWCLIFTVGKHLFFLVMFSWMLCLSVMLVHQLIFLFSPLRKRVFMFLSSIVGYVCPILIVGSSYVYYKYTDKPYYSKECWLTFDGLLKGSMHAFLLPVGTIILTNIFSMVVVIITLLKPSAADGGKADDKDTAKSIIKVMLVLTPVFGVTWGIGFLLLITDQKDPIYHIAEYSFTILNSFQGLFVLLSGCCAEQKVRQELVKIVRGKTKGQSESTKDLTSTTYSKYK